MNPYIVTSLRGTAHVCLLALLLLLPVGERLQAADDDFFFQQEINIYGTILGSREADLNGDGRPDLILVVLDQSGQRKLSSFIQRESERFPPAPSQTVRLSPSVNVVQCIDLDGNGRSEILVVDRDGLWQYTHDGESLAEEPKRLISQLTLFVGGIENGLLDEPCVQSVGNRLVAFLPVPGGLSLWEYTQGKFRELDELPFSHILDIEDRPIKLFSGQSHSRRSRFETRIPNVVIGDATGDGRPDIYLVWPDRVSVFPQEGNGRFDEERKATFHFQDLTDGNLCQARLVDYNRDNRLDLVCIRSTGGISGAQTDVNFFSADMIMQGNSTSEHHVTLTDACGNLIIDDFDNNGMPELVVPAVELGIMSTVKKMITKKTDFHILVYPLDNQGRPNNEPSVRLKISCRLDFESAVPTAGIRINWSGDYDGDGLADLVVADGGGQLLFYSGSTDGYLEAKADLVLPLADPGEIRATMLNDDGRSDLVIIHKRAGGISRLTLLVTNRIS